MTKVVINWVVFTPAICYGAWVFFQMLGALFVLGNNDTTLEVVGILACGLVPIPALLLALRHRRLAALCFAVAASFWIIGVIDSEQYLAKKLVDHPVEFGLLFRYLLKSTCVPVVLALFFIITDLLGWPLLRPRTSQMGAV